MMPGVLAHLAVGAVAAAVTAYATPLVRRFAVASGLLVAPDERNVHTAPTPFNWWDGHVAGSAGWGAGRLANW